MSHRHSDGHDGAPGARGAHRVRAAVVVASDRSAAGERADVSGPRAVEVLRSAGLDVDHAVVVPDEESAVELAIRDAVDGGARLVVTSGGTGVGPRDRTPEVTRGLLDLEIPGLAEHIRRTGAEGTPSAVLSRGVAGVVGRTVVVNLPGSPAGVEHGLAVVLPLLGHLLHQLDGGDH